MNEKNERKKMKEKKWKKKEKAWKAEKTLIHPHFTVPNNSHIRLCRVGRPKRGSNWRDPNV